MTASSLPPASPDPPPPSLSFFDAVSIIVGIVVGVSIFKIPALIFANVAGPWEAMAVWLLGGVLSLCGAFCYAELATAYPRNGGDYEYLRRAYGEWVGYLFGWAQLTVILCGSIGVMAFAFADYAAKAFHWPADWAPWFAASAVIVLTGINALGAVVGKSVQNVLSTAKILGLVGVAVCGLSIASTPSVPLIATSETPRNLGLALVFVLYAFGGWNDAAFVAAEVRDQRRNLPRALLAGIGLITAIYLVVNAAYLAALGFDGARQSWTPAAAVLQKTVGPIGERAISVLVMISALGAINGMILTGSRVYVVLGNDHPIFAWLARGNRQGGSPIVALIVQSAFSLLLIFLVGTQFGRGAIDHLASYFGSTGLPWDRYFGGFELLVAGSAPVFWLFFLLVGGSVFILRIKDPGRERPYPAPLFPLTPIVFCLTCGFMLYSSIDYARFLSLIGVIPLLLGLPFYRPRR